MIGIDFINESKAVVVRINEEIDHHACERIKNKIDLAIEFRGAKCLVFDFEGVNFMDSSGIGMVLGRYKLIQKRGGNVGVASLKPTVRKIFKMSGIFKILEEYPSVDVALENMKVRV